MWVGIVNVHDGPTRGAAADITGFAHISLRLCQFPLLPLPSSPRSSSGLSPGGLICPLLRHTQYSVIHIVGGIFPWRGSEQHQGELDPPHERIRGERIRSRQTNNEQPKSENKGACERMITCGTQFFLCFNISERKIDLYWNLAKQTMSNQNLKIRELVKGW